MIFARYIACAAVLGVSSFNGLGSAALAKPTKNQVASAAPVLTQEQADEIALEAYWYLYPLVSMDVTRKVLTAPEAAGKPGAGPMNIFVHMREFPKADFRDVVRPNFDTLYSSAWLDLTQEPVVVSHGDTKGRHFLLPMLDMWTDVFAVPGKRTSGTQAKNFLVVGPGWSKTVPEGLVEIQATTNHVWIIGRTQTNGVSDYPTVHAIQDTFRITPLSQWGVAATANSETTTTSSKVSTSSSAVDLKTSPLAQVNSMSAEKYFTYGAELMGANRPHVTDWSQVARLARIGLVPGATFDYKRAPKSVRKAMDRAVKDGLDAMVKKLPTLARVSNGWQLNTDSMGVYGNNYLKRAIVAMVGLGANQSEDAIYPLAVADSNGKELLGGKSYVMRFAKSELPPVEAFWSLTMYDEEGFQIPNELNRFAIGDRDNLKFGKDGSLELYIQPNNPGADKVSNWLPSAKSGKLGLTMRLYAPKESVLQGRWQPPAVVEENAPSVQ
jgi:hypothetical protein